ncbi:hypothetical protein JKP88DRAFT_315023 [Tribonema minus]|uniref:Uncharacterized protein n=1 Tax=Tribonema minus TaxID=303371 RepID=A0A835YZA8_9STRA|nr:hypothetical protein JKP88DRAFT_315023 [Tribonema minus]
MGWTYHWILGGVEQHCLLVTEGKVHVKGHKIDGPPTATFSDAPLSQRRIRLEEYMTEVVLDDPRLTKLTKFSDAPLSQRHSRLEEHMTEVVSYEEWVNEDTRTQGEVLQQCANYHSVYVIGGPAHDQEALAMALANKFVLITYDEPECSVRGHPTDQSDAKLKPGFALRAAGAHQTQI